MFEFEPLALAIGESLLCREVASLAAVAAAPLVSLVVVCVGVLLRVLPKGMVGHQHKPIR